MLELVSKALSYAFVIIIYIFIISITRLIYLDIRVMSRKKAGFSDTEAYLKLINLKHDLDYEVEESYPLYDDNILGRGEKSTIIIEDPFLSQNNTRIYKKDNAFYIEDLDSTNGTELNGEKLVDEIVELIDGDRISIGDLNFIFIMPIKPNEVVL